MLWRAMSHVLAVDTPPIVRRNPAPHPLPTVRPPKTGPPTSNMPSPPSSTQVSTGLEIRTELRLLNRTERSCIALLCPKPVSNEVASPSHLLSSSHRKDSRNRTATVTLAASTARAWVRTHVPTPRPIGSNPNHCGFLPREAWTNSVLSHEINGARCPRVNDGGRMPLGVLSKRNGRQT